MFFTPDLILNVTPYSLFTVKHLQPTGHIKMYVYFSHSSICCASTFTFKYVKDIITIKWRPMQEWLWKIYPFKLQI